MDFKKLKELIREMKALPRAELSEPTLFSIGGKGYYENPTTDVLAFFCNSNGPHGLEGLVLEALFKAVPDLKAISDLSTVSTPEREVRTEKGKRIDLLLEGNEWVMVLENKIYHQQNNPFETYQDFVVKQNAYQNKRHIFLVLSPDGSAPKGWSGLSYTALISSLKEALAQSFINQPLNKWLILLREFILHMESVVSKPSTPEETIDFVLENITAIKEIQDIKSQAISAFQKELLQYLQGENPDREVGSRLHHWFGGYPAIRYFFKDWQTSSDIVLFLDGRKGKSFCINYYACDIANDKQRKQADDLLKELDCIEEWNEGSGAIRCYKSPFKSNDKREMKALMAHKLKLLDQYETRLIANWAAA